jgi:LmbE family N-acetylglucosaminyl deacetylase
MAHVLFVFAHPDDESLACGGTIAGLVRRGHAVTLVSVTRGQHGYSPFTQHLSRDELGAVRAAELVAAARTLGVADVRLFDHRDGLFPWSDPAPLVADLRRTIAEIRPDLVISFGPDGLYWHPDHCEVFRRVSECVGGLGGDGPPLYEVTLPRGAMERAVDAVKRRVPSAADALWGVPPRAFGLHARAADVVVDVAELAPLKLAALRCHASQLADNHPLRLLSDDEARAYLGIEHFSRWAGDPRPARFFDALGIERRD